MADASARITIPVRLDETTFSRFARFDALRLRRGWLRPAGFAAILTAFAVAALCSGRAQAGLAAGVLLAVGLGLPAVYLGTFFAQVRQQAAAQKLRPPRQVYTVTLEAEGVRVESAQSQERLRKPWAEVQRAFRAKGCVYLYVSPVRAFLLPDGQADVPDAAVWDFLTARLGQAKCRRL